MKTDQWEIERMARTLEANGYIVRKPSEADIESVLLVASPDFPYMEIGVRLDTQINGTAFSIHSHFPIHMLLSQCDTKFREMDFPKIMSAKLSRYIADRMEPCIAQQVKAKIEPLIPEGDLGPDDMAAFIRSRLTTLP